MPDLSPVSVFIMIVTGFFGASAANAAVIGPYLVIAIGAVGGAAVMIIQREKGDGNLRAFVYFWASALLAIFLTVPAAVFVANVYGHVREQWLFFPTAFLFGFLGDKWTTVILPAVTRKLVALVDAWGPK